MTDTPARIDEIRNAIRARLRPVCEEWPTELFETMVEKLATITLRYESLGSSNPYDRRSAERLVSEMKLALERSETTRNTEGDAIS